MLSNTGATDNGNTFGPVNIVFTREITGGDTVRAYRHIDMIYFNNLPAITFDGVARILPAGGQVGIRKYYHNPKIYFWSPTWGIKTVIDTNNFFAGGVPGRNYMMISLGSSWLPVSAPEHMVFRFQDYIGYSAAHNYAHSTFTGTIQIFMLFIQGMEEASGTPVFFGNQISSMMIGTFAS
jgi:hypothetical protein